MRRLRAVGRLKRNAEPEPELVDELARAAAGEMTCSSCAAVGLYVAGEDEGVADWPTAGLCEACGGKIEPERLEALPEAVRCVACERASESGQPIGEVEYCPKCGAPLALRPTTGAGLVRWRMVCTGAPPCRL